jgi:HEPN domain-containing protein
MASADDARYRLRLADGFLHEAQEDVELNRWRSCVDNSQLAVENAAKSVAALFGPVGHTHAIADTLRQVLEAGGLSPSATTSVRRLVELAEQLGWDIHMASDYGDEVGRHTPWEIFDESAARQALGVAEEAVAVARPVIETNLGG